MEQVANNVMMTPIRGIIPIDNGAPRKPRNDTTNVDIDEVNIDVTKKLIFS